MVASLTPKNSQFHRTQTRSELIIHKPQGHVFRSNLHTNHPVSCPKFTSIDLSPRSARLSLFQPSGIEDSSLFSVFPFWEMPFWHWKIVPEFSHKESSTKTQQQGETSETRAKAGESVQRNSKNHSDGTSYSSGRSSLSHSFAAL